MLASLCRYIAKRIRDYANYAILRRKVRVERTSKVIELPNILDFYDRHFASTIYKKS